MPNSQLRWEPLYLLQYVVLLFSYLTFSSLFSINCSCFCLIWLLSFSVEERCCLKKKRNYWSALGLRQRWRTLLAHLYDMSDSTSSLFTVSSVERANEKIYFIYIYIYAWNLNFEYLFVVCCFMGSFLVEESTLHRLPNKVDIQVWRKLVIQIPGSSDPSCVSE